MKLEAALANRHKAEEAIEAVLKRDYPPGTQVVFDGLHDAVVVSNGRGDQIKVRNLKTSRERWLYAYRLITQ